jgi:hypothetical protein
MICPSQDTLILSKGRVLLKFDAVLAGRCQLSVLVSEVIRIDLPSP